MKNHLSMKANKVIHSSLRYNNYPKCVINKMISMFLLRQNLDSDAALSNDVDLSRLDVHQGSYGESRTYDEGE